MAFGAVQGPSWVSKLHAIELNSMYARQTWYWLLMSSRLKPLTSYWPVPTFGKVQYPVVRKC